MKNAFPIIVILLLVSLIVVVLRHNKQVVRFETDNAKNIIDSIPVRVYDLRPDSARYIVETVGKVQSTDEIYVVSQTAGEIKKVYVKIGERVKEGDVIAQVDDYYARQEYNMARLAYDQLQKDLDRYTDLAGVNAVTQQQLEQIRLQAEGALTKMNSLKQRLNDYLIKAPLNGIINQLFVSRGNATGLGTPVCEIVGSSSIKIEAKVNPDQAANLYVGLKATVIDEFGHGENYNAFLAELGQKAGKFGGVAAVFRMEPGQKNKPSAGSLVNIRVKIVGNPKLLLPRQALTYTGGTTGLFVLRNDHTVEFTALEYLYFDDKYISVLDTSLADRQIIIEGNYMLKTGDLVKVMP